MIEFLMFLNFLLGIGFVWFYVGIYGFLGIGAVAFILSKLVKD